MSTSLTSAQQNALIYAPKPFAALSMLSSIFAFYYLIVRHPDKRKKMYHRLVLAAFGNVFVLSFCLLYGYWALPVSTNISGAAGNNVTCAIQGSLYIVTWLAYASYVASFSIYGLYAVKNNFQQDKFQWIEKWIHVCAYAPPVTLLIISGAVKIMNPDSHPVCRVAELHIHKGEPTLVYDVIMTAFVMVDFVTGTTVILYLWRNFSEIQGKVDNYVGIRRLIESARQKRLRDVTIQTGLYLLLFSYGYFVPIVFMWIGMASPATEYYLVIISKCLIASQGFVFTIIYFVLQKPELEVKDVYLAPSLEKRTHTTVSKIRLNAKLPKKTLIFPQFSFRIFDGEPAEDSPWAQYIDVSIAGDNSEFIQSIQDREIDNGLMTSLL